MYTVKYIYITRRRAQKNNNEQYNKTEEYRKTEKEYSNTDSCTITQKNTTT